MKEITIDPRVIKHLGKDLITSSEVAVVELVKNSIDAKATAINLCLYNRSFPHDKIPKVVLEKLVPAEYQQVPILVVEDDGHGMTDDVLTKGFLTIGTSIKSGDSDSLGEKGIGRLATQRLGSALLVETSSSDESHTSYVFINWDDVISGIQTVPSLTEKGTPPHTRLWVFGIDLNDYIENAMQFQQQSMDFIEVRALINRNLKSALNFLISPFKTNITTIGSDSPPEIKLFIDEQPVDIDFPAEKLELAESTHFFFFDANNKESVLQCGLTIKPWFVERIHRAIVKSEAFKRLKKPHQYYQELIDKNEQRIANALSISVSNVELINLFFLALCSIYDVKGDEEKKDQYTTFLEEKAKKSVHELFDISPINGELYSFKQGAAIGDKIILESAFELQYVTQRYTLNELKSFLDNYNGIKLYRGSYRIGFLGDKENDWIKLQQFRTKGQQWYRFDLGNTLGYVSLSDPKQDHVKEISSRLDISENATSEAFKVLISMVFNQLFYDLTRKANDLTKIFLAEEGLLELNISQRVKKNNAALKEMMQRNKRMQKALQEVSYHLTDGIEISGDQVSLSANNYNYVTQTLETISDDIKQDLTAQESTATLLSEADAQLRAIEVESFNNYKLMANGLITETITHELHSLSKTGIVPEIDDHFSFLKDYFVKSSEARVFNQHVYPIKNSYDGIASKLEQIGDLYSFLETTFIKKGTYDEFVQQRIEDVVEDVKKNLLVATKKQNVSIICTTKDQTWLVPKGVLLHVFYNIVNNSMYWIDVRKKRAQSDSTYVSGDDSIVVEQHGQNAIIVYDTGTGVAKNMEDLLFEPLQSGKPPSEGRGMGLYIVKKLLNSFGGDIELLDEKNKFDNRYKFLIVANATEEER